MDRPAIYFFPLSEPMPIDVRTVPPGVFARRIPDFICTCLNDDGMEHASLLEIRAADSDGIPTGDWANFEELPDPADLFQFVPDPHATRLVSGTIRVTRSIASTSADASNSAPDDAQASDSQNGTEDDTPDESQSIPVLELSLLLVERQPQGGSIAIEDDEDAEYDLRVRELVWRLDLKDVGTSCVGLARRLAREFELATPRMDWSRVISHNSHAFCEFLSGLDGAARLDPEMLPSDEPARLLAPFVHALELDPDFGLALRRLHVSLHEGVDGLVIDPQDAFTLLDEAYSCYPADSKAASQLGEHLAQLGEERRAEDWLRLSINQPDPPARALETLGILLANRGEYSQARKLWKTGTRIDGHPDFFAHLARLAFREGDNKTGWDLIWRGLRRLAERRLHPGEWLEDEDRGGVIFRYLSEHLAELDDVPPEIANLGIDEILAGLVDQIREPEDRLDLGLCLIAVGYLQEGVAAIRASLPHVEDPDRRDLGAEHAARALFPDFDERLAAAAESNPEGDDLEQTREFFDRITEEIPQLWPAWYLRGRLEENVGDWARAREAYRQAATLRRDQAKIYSRLAVACAQLQEFEEAIEAISQALELEPTDAGLHADHALLLHHASRESEANEALEVAETLGADHEVVARVRRIIRGGNPADEDSQ
ncbi:MAG: tetratricopeptide repeat protein [Planctomycetes bacterium]|nr:tetratricopeptide repeat protein [Planctomycetota bacterium]MCB9919838.1 tetratricopeptide repeat protein [Planctomycetota bacterium]